MKVYPMAPEGEESAASGGAVAAAEPVATVVAPAPATPPAPADEDPRALLAALKAEREALSLKNAELDRVIGETRTGLAKERAVERRQYVRGMTLALPLTDEQLDAQLAVLGDVDARTDAGKAALAKWRETNSTFFRGPAPAPVLELDKVIEDIVGGKDNVDRKIFGGKAAMSMIQATKKSDFAS